MQQPPGVHSTHAHVQLQPYARARARALSLALRMPPLTYRKEPRLATEHHNGVEFVQCLFCWLFDAVFANKV